MKSLFRFQYSIKGTLNELKPLTEERKFIPQGISFIFNYISFQLKKTPNA